MKRIILAALLAMVAAGCGVEEYTQIILTPDPRPGRAGLRLTGTPKQLLERQEIDLNRRVPTPDNVEIDVWVIKARSADGKQHVQSSGTVLLLHAFHQSKVQFYGLGRLLAKRGYDVVLPDLRTFGDSTGEAVTYGVKEKHDIKAVVDELIREQQINPNVWVCGVTLGASTGIQYAAMDPDRVKGILAIAPYKDVRSMARIFARWATPEDFEEAFTEATEKAGFDPAEGSTVNAASKLKCPLHIVYGFMDVSVPVEQSNAILDAAPGPKKLTNLVAPGRALTTAGMELLIVGTLRDNWLADRLDELIKEGLPEE